MQKPTYVALWLRPETKKKLKLMTVKKEMTFDQLINHLMEKK